MLPLKNIPKSPLNSYNSSHSPLWEKPTVKKETPVGHQAHGSFLGLVETELAQLERSLDPSIPFINLVDRYLHLWSL